MRVSSSGDLKKKYCKKNEGNKRFGGNSKCVFLLNQESITLLKVPKFFFWGGGSWSLSFMTASLSVPPPPKNDGRIRQREPIFIQALGTLRHVVRYSIPSGVAAAAI